MDKEKQAKLEAAGWRVGDAEDFLGLSEEERQIVELRLRLARQTRERRERVGLTQEQLARKMKSSQSRVAKVETAEPGVSLDLSFRAFFAVGGRVEDLVTVSTRKGRSGNEGGKPRRGKSRKRSQAPEDRVDA